MQGQFVDLRDLYARAYCVRKLRGPRHDNTRRLYENSLGNFAAFLGHSPAFDDLTDDVLAGFIAWFLDRGRSPHTANKCAGQIMALWRFAARKGIVSTWPDVDLEECPHRDPLAWLQHELSALFLAILTTPGNVGSIRAPIWWTALHMVAWDSGERISALLGLRWKDIDLSDGWVRFPAEVRKGKKRDRTHRLHPKTIDALRPMLRGPESIVFAWPLSVPALYDHYQRILKRAGLPSDRTCKFHRMRRSTASWYEAAGGNATELLDHSGRKVTQRYLDPRVVKAKHAADVLFRPDDLP